MIGVLLEFGMALFPLLDLDALKDMFGLEFPCNFISLYIFVNNEQPNG